MHCILFIIRAELMFILQGKKKKNNKQTKKTGKLRCEMNKEEKIQ